MSTVYSGVDFVCIRRASVKQGQSLLGYELLMSKRYPVTLKYFCLRAKGLLSCLFVCLLPLNLQHHLFLRSS